MNWYFVQNYRATLQHVESRRPRRKTSGSVSGPASAAAQLELYIQFDSTREDMVGLVKALRQSSAVQDLSVVSDKQADNQGEESNSTNATFDMKGSQKCIYPQICLVMSTTFCCYI